MGFWIALAISCAMTIALYLVTVRLFPKLGINFSFFIRPMSALGQKRTYGPRGVSSA